MRYLNQTEAQKEKDYFSKKQSGKFLLTDDRDFVFYPPQFMVTGYENFDSGILGLTRNKHITHVRLKISGEPNRFVRVKFPFGHFEKGKRREDYYVDVPTLDGANEADVRVHRKDYGISFLLKPGAADPESDANRIARVEVEFEFVEVKRFMILSRLINRLF